MLSIRNLRVSVENREILHGLSLDVRPGEIVALMGPNGSGKSTLAFAIAGHPRYQVTGGTIRYRPGGHPEGARHNFRRCGRATEGSRRSPKRSFAVAQDDAAASDSSASPQNDKGVDLLSLKPDERAKLGLFLSFQHPLEIPGVSFAQMLRTAVGQRAGTPPPIREFLKTLDEKIMLLKMDPSFAERNVNEGFSGGEKKRAEILQLAVLEPQLAILDETDSGLDVDALRTVAQGIKAIRSHPVIARRGGPPRPPEDVGRAQRPSPRNDGVPMSVLLITHYERFLDFLAPDRVLVMKDGRIVAEGSKELADRIQREGYDRFT